MKKFLVIAIAIGTIVGCKKKDDGNGQLEVTMTNIAGKYKVTDETTTTNGVTVNTFSTVTACEKKSSSMFGATGSLTLADSCYGLSGNYTYTLTNGVLKTNIGGIVGVQTIGTVTSLTSTSMIANDTDTLSNSPLVIAITATTYTKQ